MGCVISIDAPLTTERLRLRPFALPDVDDALSYLSQPEVVRYLYWDVRTRDEVAELVGSRADQRRLADEGDRLVLAMERVCDSRVIGEVSLLWRSVAHRQGEIGFILHPDTQGHGFASEAATRVLDLAFEDLGLHRVCGHTDGRNTASAGLMRRLGMREEAHLVQAEIFKGEWGDELVYAVLEDEWRDRRQASGLSNHRTSQ